MINSALVIHSSFYKKLKFNCRLELEILKHWYWLQELTPPSAHPSPLGISFHYLPTPLAYIQCSHESVILVSTNLKYIIFFMIIKRLCDVFTLTILSIHLGICCVWADSKIKVKYYIVHNTRVTVDSASFWTLFF